MSKAYSISKPRSVSRRPRIKKKVFISFHYDQDRALRDLLIGQSHNDDSPFEVIDHSLHEAAPEKNWEEKARKQIAKADLVIVLLGGDTCHAAGVLKEIRIARELKVKIVQMIGHRQNYRRVPGAGILYSWTWQNLKKLTTGR